MITQPLQIRDHRQCEQALRELRARIDHIAALLEPRTPAPDAQEQARTLLAALKNELRDYATHAGSDRVQAQMSIVERTIYAPAIFDVLNDKLLIRLNTTPGPDWYEHLYDASGTVGWYLQNVLTLDALEERLTCARCHERGPEVRIRLNPIASASGNDVFDPLCDECYTEGAEDV